MDEAERNRVRGEIDQAFESGTVGDATLEQLGRWVAYMGTGLIPNDRLYPREIVRGVTLNNILMTRTIRHLEETIERLDARNSHTQRLVVILTIVAVVVAIIQVVVAVVLAVVAVGVPLWL